jgi:hypothetical protein
VANPTDITISKANYIRGETITVTLVSPDPTVYHTYDYGFSNGAGQGAGDTALAVPQGAPSSTRPIANGTTITVPTGGGGFMGSAPFFGLTLHSWSAPPFSGTGANYLGYRQVSAQIFPSASDVPSISSLGLSEGNAAVTAAAIGAYVQGVSTLKWNMVASAGAGATIAAAKLEIEGVTFPSLAGQTPALANAGTITVKGTITTSRGQTATRTETLTVLAYSAPKITNLIAYRATSSGVEDDNGTYLRMSFTASATGLTVGTQKNRTTWTLRTRPRGGSTWTTRSSATSSTSLAPTSTVTPSGFPMGTAYEVRVDVTDLFGATAAVTFVSKGGVLMDWGEGTMGVGKMWERGTLDVFCQIYQNDGKAVIDETSLATAMAALPSVATRNKQTSQSIPNISWTTITWPTAVDLNGVTYGTSGTFTATVAGLYLVSTQVAMLGTNTTGQRTIRLELNGSQYAMSPQLVPANATYPTIPSITTVVRLNVGDVVSVAAYQSSGAAIGTDTEVGKSYFSMARL